MGSRDSLAKYLPCARIFPPWLSLPIFLSATCTAAVWLSKLSNCQALGLLFYFSLTSRVQSTTSWRYVYLSRIERCQCTKQSLDFATDRPVCLTEQRRLLINFNHCVSCGIYIHIHIYILPPSPPCDGRYTSFLFAINLFK